MLWVCKREKTITLKICGSKLGFTDLNTSETMQSPFHPKCYPFFGISAPMQIGKSHLPQHTRLKFSFPYYIQKSIGQLFTDAQKLTLRPENQICYEIQLQNCAKTQRYPNVHALCAAANVISKSLDSIYFLFLFTISQAALNLPKIKFAL